MNRTLTLVAEDAQASQVVTLKEAKDHLRVTHSLEDDRIAGEIAAAIALCEDSTGRAIKRAQFLLTLSSWMLIDAKRAVRILGSVSSVDSINVRDSDGTLQFVAGPDSSPGPAIYQVTKGLHSALITEKPNQTWPAVGAYGDAIQVTFTAGWTQATIPAGLKQAILMRLGTLHFSRAPGDANPENNALVIETFESRWRLPVW